MAELQAAGHLPLVAAVARKLLPHLPAHVELDDLVQEGALGLLDAARRFDASRGACFETFARRRIEGAILDAMRAAGVRTRTWRTRDGNARRQPGNARQPAVYVDAGDVQVEHPAPGPEERMAAAEAAGRVRAAVAALPRRERFVVESYYWGGVPLKRIGAALGVNASRASQLRLRAVGLLRPILAGRGQP